MGSTDATGKAIETGMILLIMDIKKLLLYMFSKTYKLWCIEGVLYWCKYPFLTFLDKWRQATVGKADWIFNGFLSRGDFKSQSSVWEKFLLSN
jgi:hypothetical protein